MSNENYKIFLVDDDVKTLIMVKNRLENNIKAPLTVNVFAYGENCLDRIEAEKPNIVVLDFFLDAIRENAENGLEILKKIKSVCPDTEVIMMSGQEDMETALSCIRNGAYDYIIKSEKAQARLELTINKILFSM